MPCPKQNVSGTLGTARDNRARARRQLGSNLKVLFRERVGFVNRYLESGDRVLEVGSGVGLVADHIRQVDLIQTDAEPNPWLDAVTSAMALPFADGCFDAVVSFSVLHHLPYPRLALEEYSRVLRPGGAMIIRESYNSWLLRRLLAARGHEYVDETVDPFGSEYCQRSEDNWDGNNAIGNLLFSSEEKFRCHFPEFKMVHRCMKDCLLFVNSGGINHKAPYVPLPGFLLNGVALLDKLICGVAPGVFAMGQEVVFKKSDRPPTGHGVVT